MARLINSPDDASHGIKTYNEELETSNGLRERLAYVRAWYAIKTKNGWSFGPSKFIGYQGLTADDYLGGRLDGRKTEAQLAKWFQAVDDSTELYDELYNALEDFLEAYGKEPSSAVRINIVDSNWDDALDKVGDADRNAKIVDLIVEVARSLPAPQLRSLREKISA